MAFIIPSTASSLVSRLLFFWHTKLLSAGIVTLGGLCFLLSGQALAQLDSIQNQLEQLQRQDDERAQRSLETVQGRAQQNEGLNTEDFIPEFSVQNPDQKCRNTNGIALYGASAEDKQVLQRLLQPYLKRCLSVKDIESVLAVITKFYIENGFITTRAYLPSQDLTTGVLKVLIVEGTIGKIEVKDGGKNSVSIGNVFPRGKGEHLNLRDLEQGLDQINRLSSNNARFEILPGEQAGESVVVVHNKPEFPLFFQINYDNQGSDSTGKNQASALLIGENLFGFNESVSLNTKRSVFTDRSRKNAVVNGWGVNIPFGYKNLSFATSRSKYISPIALPSGLEIAASGYSQNDSLRLDTVLHRDQFTRLSTAGAFSVKETKNYLDNQFLSVSSRKLSILNLNSTLQTRLSGASVVLILGYSQGLKSLGALKDSPFILRSSPHAQFAKYTYGVEYTLPFQFLGDDFSFNVQLAGQKSNKALYGSEQFSIGGINSVRGFSNSVLSGDSGYYIRHEFSLKKTFSLKNWSLPDWVVPNNYTSNENNILGRFYIGYDTGSVHNISPGTSNGSLSGIAIGVYLSWGGIVLNLLHSRPLTFPATLTETSNTSSQTWAIASFSF